MSMRRRGTSGACECAAVARPQRRSDSNRRERALAGHEKFADNGPPCAIVKLIRNLTFTYGFAMSPPLSGGSTIMAGAALATAAGRTAGFSCRNSPNPAAGAKTTGGNGGKGANLIILRSSRASPSKPLAEIAGNAETPDLFRQAGSVDGPHLHVAAGRVLEGRQAAFARHARRHLGAGLFRQPVVPVVPPRAGKFP